MSKSNIVLAFIISLAFALRIFAIDSIPFGFTPDEASFGYDAYSILKTGKDQWGKILPITLESFGDFKLPIYSYITIPSVAVFGLTKFAVRLPNAIIGTLAVLVTFLLVRELFKKTRGKDYPVDSGFSDLTTHNSQLGLVAAFMLAISPWHIMMSRGAFEANLTTFFMTLGSLLFLKGLSNPKFMNFSALAFGLNLFTYHSARLITPLVVIILVIIYKKELFWDNKTKNLNLVKLFKPVLIFSVFLIFAFYSLFIGGGRRAKDLTIFSGALNQASEERFIAIYQGESQGVARLFHSKYQKMSERFYTNYLSYFSPNFLFVSGPAESTYGMIRGRGVLYWFEFIFLIAFIYKLIIAEDKKPYLFIVSWVIVGPIAASLTTGPGYAANRAETMLPGLTIASAVGLVSLVTFWAKYLNNNIVLRKTLYSVFIGVYLLSFIGFVEEYFIVSPYTNSNAMLYGNLEVSNWLSKNAKDKKHIILSKNLSEPHIYVAFAESWSPTQYQSATVDWERYKLQGLSFLDQLDSYSLGKYTFTNIDFKKYQDEKDTVLVGRPSEFPDYVKPIARFLYPDGTSAVVVVEPFKEAYAAKIN